LASIEHKNHHIGFGHRLTGLFGHFFVDARLGRGLKATGVNHDELVFTELPVAIVAISRQTGKIGHDRIATFR
jgi:hypothetical protein